MTYYEGPERRQNAQDIQVLADEFREFRVESRKYRQETQRDIACLREGFLAFETKYRTHLDNQLASEEYWQDLRKDITTSILKSGLMAAIAAILIVSALGGKQWLLSWLVTP